MLSLERFCDNLTMGVFGRLLLNGELLAYTVEDPWKDNKPFQSCVPNGEYTLSQHASNKWGDTVALVNPSLGVVHYPSDKTYDDQRYACLFHWGNTERAVQGCIAVGSDLGFVNGKWAVTNSKTTWANLKDRILAEDKLLITWKAH